MLSTESGEAQCLGGSFRSRCTLRRRCRGCRLRKACQLLPAHGGRRSKDRRCRRCKGCHRLLEAAGRAGSDPRRRISRLRHRRYRRNSSYRLLPGCGACPLPGRTCPWCTGCHRRGWAASPADTSPSHRTSRRRCMRCHQGTACRPQRACGGRLSRGRNCRPCTGYRRRWSAECQPRMSPSRRTSRRRCRRYHRGSSFLPAQARDGRRSRDRTSR